MPRKATLTADILRGILEKHVPIFALDYCIEKWQEAPFNFYIKPSRNTCLGDYRFRDGMHTISINHDLNPYQFLITYLHEIAHRDVQLKYKGRVNPHGSEWKYHFKEIMNPILSERVFPPNLLVLVQNHMANPPSSTTRDPQLWQALKGNNFICLKDIPEEAHFEFRGRLFKKLKIRRTRVLCEDTKNKRKYTIPLLAEIQPIDTRV